jgi:hypothetical protein
MIFVMGLAVRVFVIVLLTAFAAGAVAQVSVAAAMAVKMAHADIDGADMKDCKDCPDAGKTKPAWASLCVTPLMILPAWQESTPFFTRNVPDLPGAPGLSGYSGPPDPYLPRSLLLS